MRRASIFTFALFLFSSLLIAQPASSVAADVMKGLSQKEGMTSKSMVRNLEFNNIGPSIMSGRVTDLAVNPMDPNEFYVGYASGGVWHTNNNGTTFKPVLDSAHTQNVGDIAVDWNSGTIWVGTGENNSSRSSYAGIGILKSTDQGKTWMNMGLTDSHHVGRILINPENPDEVIVGVTGHLYSANQERGIYKTTDGGKSWNQTLFVDENSGIIDVQHAPGNFSTLFAASWTKDRKAWNFDGSGNNSAIFKSTDSGQTWTKISDDDSGFPTGRGVGRIGLAVFDDNIVYAIHDNQFRRPSEKGKQGSNKGLSKDDFKSMSTSDFLKLETEKLSAFLKSNRFPEKYSTNKVKQMVREGKAKPIDLARYLEDANSLLFDTPVIGAEVYKSADGGKSWAKTHDDYLDGIYFSYGYYFGHIYVSPANSDHIYIYGVPILKSKDGGKTYSSISAENVHADHHALWINPKNPNHLINGNDGGVNITYDDGENWIKNNMPSVGQFYAINVDNEKPYNVYGGLQDNGVWVGPHNAGENKSWHQNGQYPWESIMGGDGMQVQIDSRNSNIVYTGFQFGNYFRINRETGENQRFNIKHELGESPYRFNWQTPVLLSPHNQDIVYFGGNKLLRSMNQGDDWEAISPDLTTGGKPGNVAYGTITTISESQFQFGLIYVGSDDGYIHVSNDGGVNWNRISDNLPQDLWVSRVVASSHNKNRVYAALNGYRWDDFNVYIYVSENMGQTWKAIGNGVPMSPVNVIKEDPANENLLYVGTDNGAFVSFDRGASWNAFSKGLPSVAFHDIVIQERDKHLLLGTHGRSIYVADIAALQKMNPGMENKDITLFPVKSVRHSRQWGRSWSKWFDAFTPSATIAFYSSKASSQKMQVLSSGKNVLFEKALAADKGYNYSKYDMTISEAGAKALMKEDSSIRLSKAQNGKYYLPKGTYSISIGSSNTELKVE
ncbi:MAG: glycosyl hydrolase [Flavobacteriaceae bacterium]|nr:glycosyl hydrolase [Flavobacteriaceae bacterium]